MNTAGLLLTFAAAAALLLSHRGCHAQLRTHMIVIDAADELTNCTCSLYSFYYARGDYELVRATSCACESSSEARIAENALLVAADAGRHWLAGSYELVVLCARNGTAADLRRLLQTVDNSQFETLKMYDCNFEAAAAADDVVTVYGLKQLYRFDTGYAAPLTLVGYGSDDGDRGGLGTAFYASNFAFVNASALRSAATMRAFSFEASVAGAMSDKISAATRRVGGLGDFLADLDAFLVSVVYAD